jgi:hypothetical protein
VVVFEILSNQPNAIDYFRAFQVACEINLGALVVGVLLLRTLPNVVAAPTQDGVAAIGTSLHSRKTPPSKRRKKSLVDSTIPASRK